MNKYQKLVKVKTKEQERFWDNFCMPVDYSYYSIRKSVRRTIRYIKRRRRKIR